MNCAQAPKASARCFDVEYFYLVDKTQRLIISPCLRTLEEAKAYPVTGDISGVKCQSVTHFCITKKESERFKRKIFDRANKDDIQFFAVMRRVGSFQDFISPFYETKAQAQAYLESIVGNDLEKLFVVRGVRHCDGLNPEDRASLLAQLVQA